MDTKRRIARCAGQGTVEYVGLVLVIAALMAVGMITIDRIRAPTHLATADPDAQRVALIALLGTPPQQEPRRGWAANLAGRAGHLVVTAVRGRDAFVAGFTRAAIADLRALTHDPVGTLLGSPGDGIGLITAVMHPVATARAQAADLRRYAGELRAMDPDDAWVRLMGDLGAVGEDVALARGRRTILKRAVRVGRQMRRRDPEITPPVVAHN
jgi:hypothetical protein